MNDDIKLPLEYQKVIIISDPFDNRPLLRIDRDDKGIYRAFFMNDEIHRAHGSTSFEDCLMYCLKHFRNQIENLTRKANDYDKLKEALRIALKTPFNNL